MKSYLSLIPISAKIHRRRNRMTLICIIISVFLVTSIFGLVDMLIKMETMHSIEGHGNWHITIQNLSESSAEQIRSRSDVAAASWYDAVNLDMARDYNIGGKKAALSGIDEMFITDIMSYFTEGSRLQNDNELILSENARELLDVNAGDSITLNTPAGGYEFTISGFRSNDSRYIDANGGETTALLVKEDQIGVFMNMTAFRRIVGGDNNESCNPVYYVQFKKHTNMRKAISQIKEQYGIPDEDIGQNTIVMGVMGISDNPYIKNVYPIPVILFVLILLAGVLMISGSLNSNIVERSQFFGMLRCIGASKQQIIRFVRLEALNWCKTAIPAGIVSGVAITWGICAILRYVVGGEFADLTVFGLSTVGIISGVTVGLVTVLVAAQSPAKRAAKVSPVSAVSGNTGNTKPVRHAANARLFKIDAALGIHHAVSAKKNFILMTGSFALSIILFLSFSVMIELVGYLIPQRSSSPDLSIASSDVSNTVDESLVDEISKMPGVKDVFGRSMAENIPAGFSKEAAQDTADFISFSDIELGWLVKDKELRKGSDVSKVYGDSNYVLTIYDETNPLAVGDKVWTDGMEFEIAGILKYSPFSNDGSTDGEIIIICSEETFKRLTGESDYAIIDIHVTDETTEGQVEAIRNLAGEKYKFADRRDGGESDRSTYWALMLFVYGFLATIALITVLYIINSISMSVSARVKQYGVMRAVGMDERQLTKMIAAEAFTYAVSGCVFGCAAGLPLSRFLYDTIITAHFSYFTWSMPVRPILIILLVVLAAAAASIYVPSKRIRNMEITEIINEL